MPQQCSCRCHSPPAKCAAKRLHCRSHRQPPALPPAKRAAFVHVRSHVFRLTCTYMRMHIHIHVCAYVLMLDVACAFVWTLGGCTSNPSKGVASLERPSVPVYLSRWPVPELGRYYQRSLPAVARSGMCPADRDRAHSSFPHIQERGNLSPALACTPCTRTRHAAN